MLKNGISYGSIQSLAVLYLVVWTISPPLEIGTVYRLLALACAAVWFVIMAIRQNPIELSREQLCSAFFLLMVVTVVYIETESVSNIIKQISMFMLVICFMMNYFYHDKWDELSYIVPIVMFFLLIWNSKTTSVLLEDPTIARRLVRDDESIYEYLKQGVGGYSLVYPQVCIFPAMLAWVIQAFKNNKIYFVIGLAWLVSYVLMIANAGYSLAIFASAAGAVLLLFNKGESAISSFLVAALLFGASMLAILYLEDFRNWLLEIFDGSAVAKKIEDLVASSDSGEADGSIAVRLNAYSNSLETIFKYPVVGSLWRGNGGGHSALMDAFAKYGVFGGVMFAVMIYTVPNYYKKNYESRSVTSVANATLVTLLFVSLLDSFSYSFMCMVLLVAPLFFEDIIKWSGVKE